MSSQLSRLARRRTAQPALVVVAHGSRDPRALRTVGALLDRVRAQRPGLDVHLGHIELNEPLLTDTLARVDTQDVVLVPLLLGRGYHIKRDIPEMAAQTHPHARVAGALGPHALLVDTLVSRLEEAGWPTRPDAGYGDTAIVLAAAGSRDPDNAADTNRTAHLLSARLGVPVLPAYASTAEPAVPRALADLRARGYTRVAIASYFTAPGRFATECAAAAPWIVSAPLGAHESMARLVLTRYDDATATAGTSNAA
ncbi:sirohydrochlorin chelatase [Streptomyces niveiscabiei]|uniref:sirohydrochlorin chelatase n=1 Tax=Streptomyces niveiscabiei TaxID=164115 RepID=UPI0029B418FF|nr:sirohydrochlorin chelatase [Streptomyces niveiscabiei]MDX3384079.1 sirohydrochlorin chelatase [Streptomyces niveiscabiei]